MRLSRLGPLLFASLLPQGLAQEIYSTTVYAYASSSLAAATTTFTTSTTTTVSVISLNPTPYTGQAVLIGTCDVVYYTAIYFDDGGQLEVPMIGCSDDHPECCPLVQGVNSTVTASTPTISTTTSGLQVPTGVVSLYSAHPLTVCPKDFTDIDPVCCPSGFSLYHQPLAGDQTPCVSDLTSTLAVPSSVLSSISSLAASTALATAEAQSAKTASASVNVVINQVFALGLPCGKDGDDGNGLSNGAKVGIGLGAGVGGLILVSALAWMCLAIRRKKTRDTYAGGDNGAAMSQRLYGQPAMSSATPSAQHAPSELAPSPALGAYQQQQKHLNHAGYGNNKYGTTISSSATAIPTPPSGATSPALSGDFAQGYLQGLQSAMLFQQQQQQQGNYPYHQVGGPRSPGPPGYDANPWELVGTPRQPRNEVGELEGDHR